MNFSDFIPGKKKLDSQQEKITEKSSLFSSLRSAIHEKIQIMLLYKVFKTSVSILREEGKEHLAQLFRGDSSLDQTASVAIVDHQESKKTGTDMNLPTNQEETDPTFQFDQFLKTRNAKKHSSPRTTEEIPSRGRGTHVQGEVFAQDSNSRKIRNFKEMLEKSTVAKKEAIPEPLSKDPSLLKEEWEATSFAHIILRDLSSVEQLIAQAEQVLYARKHIDFSMEEPAVQQAREEALPVLKEKIHILKERTSALKERAVSPEELRDILNTARIIKDDFRHDGALNIDTTVDQIIFDTISDEEIDQMGVKHIKTDFNDEKKQD